MAEYNRLKVFVAISHFLRGCALYTVEIGPASWPTWRRSHFGGGEHALLDEVDPLVLDHGTLDKHVAHVDERHPIPYLAMGGEAIDAPP